jgi:hypothetical protein
MADIIDFDGARVTPYLKNAIALFLLDPPDTEFQCGFLAALLIVDREGLGHGEKDDLLQNAERLLRDQLAAIRSSSPIFVSQLAGSALAGEPDLRRCQFLEDLDDLVVDDLLRLDGAADVGQSRGKLGGEGEKLVADGRRDLHPGRLHIRDVDQAPLALGTVHLRRQGALLRQRGPGRIPSRWPFTALAYPSKISRHGLERVFATPRPGDDALALKLVHPPDGKITEEPAQLIERNGFRRLSFLHANRKLTHRMCDSKRTE